MIETAAGADENLVQRPLAAIDDRCAHAARCRCFSAWALAASRTQAPSACALRRAASRCALQGPFAFEDLIELTQSMGPNS